MGGELVCEWLWRMVVPGAYGNVVGMFLYECFLVWDLGKEDGGVHTLYQSLSKRSVKNY